METGLPLELQTQDWVPDLSRSADIHLAMEEEIPLNVIAGPGDRQDDQAPDQVRVGGAAGRVADFFCKDEHHRKLAVCSIICGISCIGIKALIHSVEAEKTTNKEDALTSLRKAKKFGIISIATWLALVVSVPLLMGLISYLLTLSD